MLSCNGAKRQVNSAGPNRSARGQRVDRHADLRQLLPGSGRRGRDDDRGESSDGTAWRANRAGPASEALWRGRPDALSAVLRQHDARSGVALDDGRHGLDASLRFELDRPTLDVGDEFGQGDALLLAGEYGYRVTPDWEVKGLADVQHQAFEFVPGRTNTLAGLGGGVRYRGFGSTFSPEVGFLTGARDATDDNEDHSQTDLYVKARSAPMPRLYVSARYRHRARDYSIGSPLVSNFGREDRRNQITALAEIQLVESVALNVYYAFQDANSTLAERTFTTQLLSFGLSVGR